MSETATEIGVTNPQTLADIEQLCAEARTLGFPDTAKCGVGPSSIKFTDATGNQVD